MNKINEPRNIQSLGVKKQGEMYIWQYEEGPLPKEHFRVETLFTGLSAGTELSFFKGTNPYFHSRWDNDLGVFIPNEPGLKFPVPFLGYMEVGRVQSTLSSLVREGDIVAMAYGHKTGHTVNAADEFFVRLPPDIDPLLGIYVAQMGPICGNGLLHAAADLFGTQVTNLGDGVRGRNVVIMGAGVIGLLIALWSKHLGAAEVAIIDSTPQRLTVANTFGIETINEHETDPVKWCKQRWVNGTNDRGADVVFQCRGQAAALQTSLKCLRPQGAVIDLAFYQDGAEPVRLGEEFHHNGLKIQCAQIGRVPRGLAHAWNRRRLAAETLDLLQAHGSLIKDHLVTDIVPFNDAPQLVADLAERKRNILQAVFKVQD